MIEIVAKAICFDLDDTLCTYWDAAKAGLRATFQALAPEGFTSDAMLSAWAAEFKEFCPHLKASGWRERYWDHGGSTRTELMRRTLVRLGIESGSLADDLSQQYFEERQRALVLFPDAERLLDRLGEAFPLGLITNGPADIQRAEMERLGLASRFQAVMIEGELKFGKPEPRVFRLAEERLGTGPGDLVFIGNSFSHDILPAIACGWKTVWVRRSSDVPPSATGDAVPEPIPTSGPMPTAIVNSFDEAEFTASAS